jgi:hypothetical protein
MPIEKSKYFRIHPKSGKNLVNEKRQRRQRLRKDFYFNKIISVKVFLSSFENSLRPTL